jgi:predicted nucleic acid-binding protein
VGGLNALLDTDVLLDFLDGHPSAAEELARYRHHAVSIITWMEVLTGARTTADEQLRREFLGHFRVVPLTGTIAEEAIRVRRSHRLKLPDAIIWATATIEKSLLVSRNTKDFPTGYPGVRFPYRR